MAFQIVEKGTTFAVKDEASGAAITNLYVGAGWDVDDGKAVDLDLVAACLSGGKLTAQTRLVYFGDKNRAGCHAIG
jgi:stress response protein SCP2